MRIREAEPADSIHIVRLLGELGYELPVDLLVDKLNRIANSNVDAAFVATQDDTILGCISAHAFELFHAPGRLGRITSLIVDQRHRGSGIGRALVEQATAFFDELGCVRMEVTSGDHRPDAHSFYKAMGFVIDERRFIRPLGN